MDITFHYPPELLNLLVDTIPLLNRSKPDVLLFFQGAGVPHGIIRGPRARWLADKTGGSKYDITRDILTALNAHGEGCLRERREVLKRVVEFESFSACWPGDQLKAKGLVAEIGKVVNVKDSFTRIAKEREAERQQRVATTQSEIAEVIRRRDRVRQARDKLFGLFGIKEPQARGKALEAALNDLFTAYGVLIREAFALTGQEGEGVVEQVDGVVEIDGHLYFVEMKWWNKPLGRAEVSEHLVRVYQRAEGRAIIVSASDFTAPAVLVCRDALQQKVVVLVTVEELVQVLEKDVDLVVFLREKVRIAQVEKDPCGRVSL